MQPNLPPRNPMPSAFADAAPRTIVRLMFGKVPVTVSYVFGTMLPRYQGGMDITAKPQGCTGCLWAQVYQRTGDGVTPPTRDGAGYGPLYGTFPPFPEDYFWDSPSIGRGGVGTFTGTAILGVTDRKQQTFASLGSMIYGFGVDKSGDVRMTIAPRLTTRHEFTAAIDLLKRSSAGWTVR